MDDPVQKPNKRSFHLMAQSKPCVPVQKPNKRSFHLMAQSKPCVMCKKPVTKQTILMCCEQPCHLTCATQWGKKSTNPDAGCFICGYGNSIPVLEILNEEWKEDPQFVKEVKRNWSHTSPLSSLVWYRLSIEVR